MNLSECVQRLHGRMQKTRLSIQNFIIICMYTAIAISSEHVCAEESYSPYVGMQSPTRIYWGDTHLHTSLSTDAYAFGNRIGLAEAYRFARGEVVATSNGMQARLRRPLDFLVAADHAESVGVFQGLQLNDATLAETEDAKRLLAQFDPRAASDPTDLPVLENATRLARQFFWAWSGGRQTDISRAFTYSVWKTVTATADQYNDPGRFTAFIGYEWTSNGKPGQGDIHRNVIFKDDAQKAVRIIPFSAMDSQDPEDLWAFMGRYERETGGEVIAIPHNGNLSKGAMFSMQNLAGAPIDRSYSSKRARWEPLYEVTQTKGTSEAHPFLSPADEFANYEIWNGTGGTKMPEGRTLDDAERAKKEGEYARRALLRGLILQREIQVNPFKFGLIGGSDSHTSLAALDENNFWGIAPTIGPGVDRLSDKFSISGPLAVSRALNKNNVPDRTDRAWMMSASGYAGVWATENTREALFAAMKRKEVYATTGPRIEVRFFGGWDFSADDSEKPDLPLIGYRKGVPMGGDLTSAPAGKAASFLIRAVKDPDGANLDRLQVIKGWLDNSRVTHERIYDVALSDGRKRDRNGKIPPVGSTVNVEDASYTNSIGDPELAVVWTDPDFNKDEHAFYYVRVIEIPTPRWTAYDAKFFGIRSLSNEVPLTVQERGYTSPIWYTPTESQ